MKHILAILLLSSSLVYANHEYETLKEKCERITGEENIFAELTIKFAQSLTCVDGTVNATDFQSDISTGLADVEISSFKPFASKYCPKFYHMLDCAIPPINILKKCYEEDEFSSNGIEPFKEALDFLCEADYHNVVTFVSNKGIDCFQNSQEQIAKKCRDNEEKTENSQNNHLSTDCILRVFDDCGNDKLSKLMREVVELRLVKAFLASNPKESDAGDLRGMISEVVASSGVI